MEKNREHSQKGFDFGSFFCYQFMKSKIPHDSAGMGKGSRIAASADRTRGFRPSRPG
jgi:hypothetical protein